MKIIVNIFVLRVGVFPTGCEVSSMSYCDSSSRWRGWPACSAALRQLSHTYIQSRKNTDKKELLQLRNSTESTVAREPPACDTIRKDANYNTEDTPTADVQNRNRPRTDGE